MTEKRYLKKRTEIGTSKNIALCNAIPPGFAPLKDITNEEIAPHTESNTTKLEILTEPPLISYCKLENP